MVKKADYVELGITCAEVCEALDLGMGGRQADQLSRSVLGAIEKLTRWVEPAMRTPDDFLTRFSIRTMDEAQRHIIERSKRNAISRRYHAKEDKEAIATWKLDLNGVLGVFNVCSATSARRLLSSCFQNELRINADATASDIHQDAAKKPTVVSDVHHDDSNVKVTVPDVHCDVLNANPVVSDIQSDVANTRTVVSDNKLKSREGADGQNRAVSAIRILPVAE